MDLDELQTFCGYNKRVSVHIMKILYLSILLLFSLTANATAQVADILIWKGETLSLFSNPLELRSDWKEISKIISLELENEDKRLYPEKYKSEEVEAMFSTACWRGYVAEWIIINDKIYLNNIYACHDNKVKVDLKKIFGKELKDNLLFGDWITNKLNVPKGECIEYVHLGYNSIYETETILDLNKGVLVDSKTYNNYISKESKFSIDPNPNNYLDFIYTQVDWKKIPDLKNNHIQVFIGIQPNKDGKIESILSNYTYMLDYNGIITDSNNVFIKEAIRIAELIPDWEVVYQRGLITSRSFSIVFNEKNRKKYAR